MVLLGVILHYEGQILAFSSWPHYGVGSPHRIIPLQNTTTGHCKTRQPSFGHPFGHLEKIGWTRGIEPRTPRFRRHGRNHLTIGKCKNAQTFICHSNFPLFLPAGDVRREEAPSTWLFQRLPPPSALSPPRFCCTRRAHAHSECRVGDTAPCPGNSDACTWRTISRAAPPLAP